MKNVNLILILFFGFCSCSSFQEKHISEFIIDKTILKDGELVEIIYFPGSPDYNTNLEYFVKAIVVSKETNDTINVLTTNTDDLPGTGHERNFIPYGSDMDKVFEHILAERMKGNTPDNFHPDDLEQKKIEKVLLNKKFIDIENNNYPVTIGTLGHVIDNN